MTIEMPYSFMQAVIFMIIGYPGVGYYMTVRKFLWFFYVKYCSILYFNYLGMFIVSITPNAKVGLILAATLYLNLILFTGFVIPGEVSKQLEVSFIKYLEKKNYDLEFPIICSLDFGCSKFQSGGFGFTISCQVHGFLMDFLLLNMVI